MKYNIFPIYINTYMNKQSGFIWLPLIIFALITAGVVGVGAAAVYGKAPQCPNAGTTARSETEISSSLKAGSVTITDGEATTLAQNYIGRQVKNAKVCFSSGEWHISGSIPVQSIEPTFYISAGVDLSGSVPAATNLKIQLGSLPDLPLLSSALNKSLNSMISQGLGKIKLDKTYSAEFTQGSVTVK